MNNYKIIGIDLANNVFQVAALNQANKVVFNKKVSRKKFAETIQQLPSSSLAMEACGSANYWAKRFTDMGHSVRLVPAQHVKVFVKGRNKNDAVAICEAALRPNVHFEPIKTVDQQDL